MLRSCDSQESLDWVPDFCFSTNAPSVRLTLPYARSTQLTINSEIVRFYGFTENKREVDMDMREMVDKVKKGEPLYGVSSTTPYIQGMASRNSRYSGVFLHVLPWFNFVNHNQHGVDTAKYYQQAERELEAEKVGQGLQG